jgi:hypothetical protein
MEKRIKSFTQFFESVSYDVKGGYRYSVSIEAAEDYGYPIFVLRDGDDIFDVDGNIVDTPDIEDLFEEYMDADHGPMNGMDSFGDLVSAVEEYVDYKSEENLESIDGWLGTLGLSGIDPVKLADSYEGDNTYWNETLSKFQSNMRIQFDGDYFGDLEGKAWSFLILSSESVEPEIYGDEVIHNDSPRFSDFFKNAPFNLCYNNDSEDLYSWVIIDQNKYEFVNAGLEKNDLELSTLDLALKILNSGNMDIILPLFKNFILGIKDTQLYSEIIQRLQEEGKTEILSILKGGGMLGRFGAI